uniref:Tyrosine-protein kinase n=1 Tax=Trichuris muris TaxID=70415 RepID=A0A5S6QLA8_TRIMR
MVSSVLFSVIAKILFKHPWNVLEARISLSMEEKRNLGGFCIYVVSEGIRPALPAISFTGRHSSQICGWLKLPAIAEAYGLVSDWKMKSTTHISPEQGITMSKREPRSESRRANLISDHLVNDPIWEEFYFYGLLPREDVEMMLLHEGEFLVRQSKKVHPQTSGVVISVRWKNEISHVIILKCSKGYVLEGNCFPTIKDLIKFYRDNKVPVTKQSGAVLQTPIHRANWVLHESQISFILKVGEGQFGEVWKAELTQDNGKKQLVAVKTLKSTEVPKNEQKEFFDECRRLRQLRHQNIVNFKGVSLDSSVMLIMELCDIALLDYLSKYEKSLSSQEYLKLVVHAARGMVYLSSQKCIHRDLAARNCLIKDSCLKIGDFGMARTGDLYKMKPSKTKILPIKWTAPDTLMTRNYSEKSDVWSFGVLMWEIYTNGSSPYADLAQQSKGPFVLTLINFLRSGKRLIPPPSTPKQIASIMLRCWENDPNKRPKFADLCRDIEAAYQSLYSQSKVPDSQVPKQRSIIRKR